MLYFQTPIIEKLYNEEPTVAEAKNLTKKYLEKCKRTRELVNEDQNGVFKIKNIENLKQNILKNQKNLPDFINKKNITYINSIKPSIFKNVMSYTGISGYYNPFTAEAQYNAELPSSIIPFTIAHESAHQLGYAREQEASFIGYLIGKNSDNLDLKYSTEYFVLKSLLQSLAEKNHEFVKQLIANYSTKMKKDRAYERNFKIKHEGFLDNFFAITNNLFLKSNQQDGSVTYSYFVDLLLRYEKQE